MPMARQDIIETEIPVSQLQIGMHVIRLDRPWEETDFLLQGFILQTKEDVFAVQQQCEKVTVEGKVHVVQETSGSSPANRRKTRSAGTSPASSPIPKRKVTYVNKVDASHEMSAARMSYTDAKATARNIMSSLRLGRTLEMNKIRQVVDDCVDSVLRNDNALLLLSKIKNKDEYTAEHCINVAILSAAFGKHLGLLEGEIRNVALCGLLHDVGKMRIDDEILNNPGALTPEQFAVMKNHTTFGRDVLAALPRLAHSAVDVAYSHHERMDGKGYPRGLSGHQIPLFAKIVGLADTYDAITSSRVYDKGRASMEALHIIHRNKGAQFDEGLAVEFIRMIGVYPPGSIVEMTNAEVGIVLTTHTTSKLKPRVLLVRAANKQPLATFREVDLAEVVPDSAGQPYRIAREVPDGSYGIVMREFIEQGIFSRKAPPVSAPVDHGHGEP
ncbi:HD-GYP domain-containing protein [Marinobacter orientalis]|uniref:HD-GYP domain-containing protein n=1 Tax=Marinobacter orientalis TaxID=1928859 RepID=A0A7Y0NL65_9GAMM|nr:HD-GYP domain-containing protein [Marinobacter orientalis]NMT63049.1 HD-GYP domain-containing protein [Marinobacter orientalis]TGX51710.1 HD-GYP domain-containing protein [Marinobacter orientalis]